MRPRLLVGVDPGLGDGASVDRRALLRCVVAHRSQRRPAGRGGTPLQLLDRAIGTATVVDGYRLGCGRHRQGRECQERDEGRASAGHVSQFAIIGTESFRT